MTTPFNPADPLLTDGLQGGSQKTGYLPNGQYDIYNLGALWDKTLYLGNQTKKPDYVDTSTLQGIEAVSHPSTVPVTSTPLEYLQQFASWSVTSPDQYAALQQQLYQSGFYGSSKPRLGIYSTSDAKAMKEAITGYLGVVNPANPNPLTLSDYLDHASAQGQQDQKAAPAAPLQVTDPSQIRSAAQAAFQAATGKGATDAQLNAFVAQFQSQQTSAQTAVSGTVSSPDLSAEAMQYAQGADPQQFADHQRESYISTLVNMFAPSQSQRPNSQPVSPVGG